MLSHQEFIDNLISLYFLHQISNVHLLTGFLSGGIDLLHSRPSTAAFEGFEPSKNAVLEVSEEAEIVLPDFSPGAIEREGVLSNGNLVLVLVVGANEEEEPAEEQGEQAPNIRQHFVQFVMCASDLVHGPSLLYLYAHVVGRV